MGVKVTITTEARPVYNGRPSNVGETIEVSQAEADQIVERGWGEVTSSKKKRARNEKGHYVKDNPETPQNEAWE
tara:strand:- start:460 stop:681 length:222 start_codon:yes stop_codon:yes gene_type:complete